MIKMDEKYCAICKGTGYYDQPKQTGGYKATQCDHTWEEGALNHLLSETKTKYEKLHSEYIYLIKCKSESKRI